MSEQTPNLSSDEPDRTAYWVANGVGVYALVLAAACYELYTAPPVANLITEQHGLLALMAAAPLAVGAFLMVPTTGKTRTPGIGSKWTNATKDQRLTWGFNAFRVALVLGALNHFGTAMLGTSAGYDALWMVAVLAIFLPRPAFDDLAEL